MENRKKKKNPKNPFQVGFFMFFGANPDYLHEC